MLVCEHNWFSAVNISLPLYQRSLGFHKDYIVPWEAVCTGRFVNIHHTSPSFSTCHIVSVTKPQQMLEIFTAEGSYVFTLTYHISSGHRITWIHIVSFGTQKQKLQCATYLEPFKLSTLFIQYYLFSGIQGLLHLPYNVLTFLSNLCQGSKFSSHF